MGARHIARGFGDDLLDFINGVHSALAAKIMAHVFWLHSVAGDGLLSCPMHVGSG